MGFWKNDQNTFRTPEGGYAIRIINKTGANSIKGTTLKGSSSFDNGVELTVNDDVDPIGIMYSNGVPDGEYVWIVKSGKAYVLYGTAVTRGTFARIPVVADSIASGRAVAEALPTPPLATDKHFQEIGHPIESIGAPGLALTMVHFN